MGGKYPLLGVVLAAMLIAPACSNESESHPGPVSAPAPASSPAAQIRPSSPPPAPSHDTLEILSVLSVERSVDLLAQRDGVVKEIFYDEQGFAKEGAELARLDDRELLAKIQNTRLDLQVAENNLKFIQAERKAKEAAYRRQQELRKCGLSSQAALEEAEFRAKGAGYDEASWSAGVERKKSEIHELEIELEKTRFIAPFSGYVVRRSIRVGQNVVKNDPCFRISQLRPLEVKFLVPESAGEQPKAGATFKVLVVEDSSHDCGARVKMVSPTIDPASGSYVVTAELKDSDSDHLRPGMAVKVLWPMKSRKPSL